MSQVDAEAPGETQMWLRLCSLPWQPAACPGALLGWSNPSALRARANRWATSSVTQILFVTKSHVQTVVHLNIDLKWTGKLNTRKGRCFQKGTQIAQPLVGFLCMFFFSLLFVSDLKHAHNSNIPFPGAVAGLGWGSLLGTHPVPQRIGPWWLGTDPQTDRALRNKEPTEAANPSSVTPPVSEPRRHPAAPPGTQTLQTPPVPFPVSGCGLPRPSGRCWVHRSHPEQPHTDLGTAGSCCFRVVNHYKMLVMFCLSRGKKNKIQKEKVWVGVKAALDMMQRGILSVLIKISNVWA